MTMFTCPKTCTASTASWLSIYLMDGERIILRDYPTTLVTSYSTARTILNLKANDSSDPMAEQRFAAKELNLFEAALHALLDRDYLRRYMTH